MKKILIPILLLASCNQTGKLTPEETSTRKADTVNTAIYSVDTTSIATRATIVRFPDSAIVPYGGLLESEKSFLMEKKESICYTPLPHFFTLVRNKKNHRYAVRWDNPIIKDDPTFTMRYLKSEDNPEFSFFTYYTEATTFKDSCTAKKMVWKYLYVHSERLKEDKSPPEAMNPFQTVKSP